MKLFRRKPAKAPLPKIEAKPLLKDETHDIFVMYEHERRRADLGWSFRNLEAGDPKRYAAANGVWQSNDQDADHLVPVGWRFQGKW